jgi:dTDP-4-dehydrorhamnose reductase
MRILVTGAGGQLGAALLELIHGHELHGTKRPDVDLRDRVSVRRAIQSFRPDVIIHAAALTKVDYCEDHADEARDVNVEGTRHVVEAAGRARVVYLSTEYVFDGKAGPYREDDPPNPESVYARTKYDGELVARQAERWTIIRTTVVFTYRPGSKNFLMQVLEGKPMRIPRDQISNPTLTENLAEAVTELVDRDLGGIWNIVGADRVDRFAFAQHIAKAFKLDASRLEGVTTAELRQRAARPLNAGLVIDKARRELKTRLLTLDEALALALRKSRP